MLKRTLLRKDCSATISAAPFKVSSYIQIACSFVTIVFFLVQCFFLGELIDLLRDDESNPSEITDEKEKERIQSNRSPVSEQQTLPEIYSGETISLKKSTFQGHAAIVYTVDDVKRVLKKLQENRKVSQATHNIVAYRLSGVAEGSFVQDYADDGEINAGSRVLHLLQIMDVKNVVVVVSRWYGGILLGPDRFRLINNCAREAITALPGVYEPKQEKSKGKKKKH